jgi:cation diffusion facilitator family transporter
MQSEAAGSKPVVRSKTLYASIVLNLVLMTLQIVMGRSTHSDGLLADGVHTLVDLIADALMLAAFSLNARPPGRRYDVRGSYDAWAALAVGGLLMVTGVEMLWHASQWLGSVPHPFRVDMAALWVAVFALLAKETLFQCMVREARRMQSAILHANAWHARSDAVSSLLVVLGITGNLAGLSWLDELAAALIGLMVLRLGCNFAWSAVQDLSGRALSGGAAEEIAPR